MSEGKTEGRQSLDFIRTIVAADVAAGKNGGRVVTRFPPEPNGYLHIGHAKAFCLNFGIAAEYGGQCHLRMDDTNPEGEDMRYVEAMKEDIRWLGCDWGDDFFYASDYFGALHDYAVQLITAGKAYVCDLSPAQIRDYRGTLTKPGKDSPHRDRSVEDNIDLFSRMKAGEFPDGARVLRARIDMASPNLNLRDPVMYRIVHAEHYRVGPEWYIYPTYDWAHGLEDSIEGVTHSLCDVDFENHRPLYDWFLDQLDVHHPQQIEFGRMNVTYTVTSKRKLLLLVEGGHVEGWDDPRMPTISGMRRRGYTPLSIRKFIEKAGVTKLNTLSDIALLEHCVRDDLNRTTNRVMAVLSPLKVVIENFPEGEVDMLDAVNNPEDPSAGTRKVPFSRVIYIEKDDFLEEAPRKFFRLAPGREVRLRYGFFITCTGFEKDEKTGEIVELRCSYDPETRGGQAPDGRKVRGTIHWVSADQAIEADVRLYDRLFDKENPDDVETGGSFIDNVNQASLKTVKAYVETSLAQAEPGARYQFERIGYFTVDSVDSAPGKPVFNRTVALRDSWAKHA